MSKNCRNTMVKNFKHPIIKMVGIGNLEPVSNKFNCLNYYQIGMGKGYGHPNEGNIEQSIIDFQIKNILAEKEDVKMDDYIYFIIERANRQKYIKE